MGKRGNGRDVPHGIAKKMWKISLVETAKNVTSNNTAMSQLETLPAELRVEIYRSMLPRGPIRLDYGAHLSRRDFLDRHLHLTELFHAGLQLEYLYEYFNHIPFTVQKHHSIRNMSLETGLILLREANVERIRMLTVDLDDRLTVELAFKGSTG